MTESWYDRSLEQIEHRFDADRGRGLTREKVTKLRKKYGSNNVYPTKVRKFFEYRKYLPTDFASLILLAAAAVAAVAAAAVAAAATADSAAAAEIAPAVSDAATTAAF